LWNASVPYAAIEVPETQATRTECRAWVLQPFPVMSLPLSAAPAASARPVDTVRTGAAYYFGVQTLVSHLWLARFRFGPAEWLWRSLTYGKAQPMRRSSMTHAKEFVNA